MVILDNRRTPSFPLWRVTFESMHPEVCVFVFVFVFCMYMVLVMHHSNRITMPMLRDAYDEYFRMIAEEVDAILTGLRLLRAGLLMSL